MAQLRVRASTVPEIGRNPRFDHHSIHRNAKGAPGSAVWYPGLGVAFVLIDANGVYQALESNSHGKAFLNKDILSSYNVALH
jgi:hypothetical protein